MCIIGALQSLQIPRCITGDLQCLPRCITGDLQSLRYYHDALQVKFILQSLPYYQDALEILSQVSYSS